MVLTDTLNLVDLRMFLLLAKELHFGRTAESVGVAQPVLSRRIARLERTIGVSLLERSSRSVALTPEGRRLTRDGAKALAALDQALAGVQTFRQRAPNTLRIGFTRAAEPLLRALQVKWRGLHYEVQLLLLSSAQQVAALRRRTIDIGFLRPPNSRGDIVTQVLRREPVVCVLPLTHRLARERSICLGQLGGERLVRFKPMIGVAFQRRIETEIRRRNIKVEHGPSVDDTRSVQSLVSLGGGIALLPAYVAESQHAGLAYVPITDLPAFIPLAVAMRSGENRREVLRAMEIAIEMRIDVR